MDLRPVINITALSRLDSKGEREFFTLHVVLHSRKTEIRYFRGENCQIVCGLLFGVKSENSEEK